MPSRGVYRGIYSAMPDDLDFQRLPPHARLLLYTLRVCRDAGPAAIFPYSGETLMRQTGLSRPQLASAFAALEADSWILREPPLVWIRNALRYDPTLRLADPKHRSAV